jgi:hypothetical protein
MLTRLRSWSTALLSWLAEAHLLWLALGVVALALVASLHRGTTDLQIRSDGLVLQLLGIGTVAHGIHETRKFFGRPGILSLLRDWLSRFPRWRRQVIVGTGTGSLGLASLHARAHVWTPMDPLAPVDAQVKALIQNVERLNQSLIQVQQEMDAALGRVTAALGEERTTRSKDVAELQKRLEIAETGGLHITFVGVIWLVVGVVLTTLSPEILRWRW